MKKYENVNLTSQYFMHMTWNTSLKVIQIKIFFGLKFSSANMFNDEFKINNSIQKKRIMTNKVYWTRLRLIRNSRRGYKLSILRDSFLLNRIFFLFFPYRTDKLQKEWLWLASILRISDPDYAIVKRTFFCIDNFQKPRILFKISVKRVSCAVKIIN